MGQFQRLVPYRSHPGYGCFFLVVSAACTAQVQAPDLGQESGSGGIGTTGGTGGTSVTTGSTNAVQSDDNGEGRTDVGGASAGGTSSTCAPDFYCRNSGLNVLLTKADGRIYCNSDSDCNAGATCFANAPAVSCTCTDQHWMMAWDISVNACVPFDCSKPISSALTSPKRQEPCDVVLRVNADATDILGYRVVCGESSPTSRESLHSQLLAFSSVNWSEATAYGSAETHYLFVHTNTPYSVIGYSGVTAQKLFEVRDTSSPTVLGDWSPASDLDGVCVPSNRRLPTILGPENGAIPSQAITTLLDERGVFAGLKSVSSGENRVVVVRTDLPEVEYFVIVSTSPEG